MKTVVTTIDVASKKISLAFFLAVLSTFSFGEGLLHTAGTTWYELAKKSSNFQEPILSIKIEITGLSQREVAQLVASVLEGEAKRILSSDGTGREAWEITGSRIGKISLGARVVNGHSESFVIETQSHPAHKFIDFQRALDAIKQLETTKTSHPSIGITIDHHVRSTLPAATATKFAQNLIGNITYPHHRRQMEMDNQNPIVSVDNKSVVKFQTSNDWSLASVIRSYTGLSYVTETYGAIDHDKFISEVSGFSADTLAKLRTAAKKSVKSGDPYLIRYLLADHKTPFNPAQFPFFDYYGASYRGTVTGRIPANLIAHEPLHLEGESVVWHVRPFHGANILGKHNPGILNENLSTFIANNKYFEYKLFEKYVPGVMPKTILLNEATDSSNSLDTIVNDLNKRFPKGWVLKYVKEQNTGPFLISDNTDLKKELEAYRKSDFDAYAAEVYRTSAGLNDDVIVEKIQKHPNYRGWKIANFFKNPDLSFVQEKVDIESEYRVESIGGRVLGKGSTVDRHFYLKTTSGKAPKIPSEKLAKIEGFVQSVIDKLPKEIRGIPFPFDVALLRDGSFVLIESNAGPESGFLIDYPPSIRALNSFLRNYPEMLRKGLVTNKQLARGDQIRFILDRMKEWNMDPKRHLEALGMMFMGDRIIFPAFEALPINPAHFQVDCRTALAKSAGLSN